MLYINIKVNFIGTRKLPGKCNPLLCLLSCWYLVLFLKSQQEIQVQPKTSREDLVLWPQWELHLVKSFSLLEQITFQHGKKSFLPEDQVVQYLDAKDVACLPEPSGYILVLHARLEIAAGVVVGNHDGSGTLTDCLRKYFQLYLADCTL